MQSATIYLVAFTLLLGLATHAAAVTMAADDCKALTATSIFKRQFSCSPPPRCDSSLASKGIVCNGRGYVIKIDLVGKQLNGPLPPQFGKLSALKSLDMSQNFLTDAIPDAAWANLTNTLEELYLNQNSLEGTLPKWIVKANKLKYLDLSLNQLVGKLPTFISDLPNLVFLNLGNNQIGGGLPYNWYKFQKLQFLSILQNKVTGPVPVSWNMWKSPIRTMILGRNALTGALPGRQLSRLRTLQTLDLSGNKFIGVLPVEWGDLTNLSILDISGNAIYGRMRGAYQNWIKLRKLVLTNTKVSTPLRVFNSHDTPLDIFISNFNQICGPIPANVRVFWQGVLTTQGFPASCASRRLLRK